MHWLLIGYMFLFIHRPFEVWPALGDLHVERVYMLFTMAVWALAAPKRFLPNWQHLANAGFITAVLACWVMSPWSAQGQPVVEDYLKIVVFYVLLVTSVYDERGLKRVAMALLGVMTLYLLHSLREYLGGRHTYRMGISRMLGVDKTYGDPNTFGASIVFVLPFVTAMWNSGIGGKLGRYWLMAYVALSGLCILLTGSRGSLMAFGVWAAITILRGPKKWAWIAAVVFAAPVVFVALPESLQNRFHTIVDPSVGPANAAESGEGRLVGFFTGLELWGHSPLSGVGPGAWRPATGSSIESHNLYGQLMGEMGGLGVATFVAVLACFAANLWRIRAVRRDFPEWQNDLVFQVPAAIGTAVFLLLLLGAAGHNLFRYTWLWYGGLLIISRYCIEARLRAVEAGEYEFESEEEEFEEELPEGWTVHEGHEPVGASAEVGEAIS